MTNQPSEQNDRIYAEWVSIMSRNMSGRMPDQFPDALHNKMSDSMSEYMSKYMSDKMSGCMPDRMPDKGGIECQLVGITRRHALFWPGASIYLDAHRLWVKVQGGQAATEFERPRWLLIHLMCIGRQVRNLGFGLRTSIWGGELRALSTQQILKDRNVRPYIETFSAILGHLQPLASGGLPAASIRKRPEIS